MSPDSVSRIPRTIFSFLELILKQIARPGSWRPAGAVRELPPTALVYDAAEEKRAEGVFQTLSGLGFAPTKVAAGTAAGDEAGVCRSISSGTEGCGAVVVLEPEDAERARKLGLAFREFAHSHPDIIAIVVGPLPSRAEILDRYRHVVTEDDGGVSPPDLAAGVAHASAARVLHYNRLLSAAMVFFFVVVVAVGVGMTFVGWRAARP